MAHQLLDERARLPLPVRAWERTTRRGPGRLLALLALAAFFVAIGALVATGLSTGGKSEQVPPAKPRAAVKRPPAGPQRTAPRKVGRPAVSAAIKLAGVGAYDPDGDGHEYEELAPLATDGDPSTSWHTEHYRSWYKPGVGLVLDEGRPVRTKTVTLVTDTPGFAAEIQAGSSPQGPFTRVSESGVTGATTVFHLREPSPYRYLLVWITRIDSGAADISEVRAR